MSYTNADSIEDKVIASLLWNLGQITTANGYNYTVGDLISDSPLNVTDINNFPGCVVVPGPERASLLTTATSQGDTTDSFFPTLQVLLYFYMKETENTWAALRKLKRDVQKMIGINPMLRGQDNQETCFLARYASSVPYEQMAGIKIGIEISYQAPLNGG